MVTLLVGVGIFQSWNVALQIFNLCLISAIMALGVNIQWGYAGLFNVGIMGFAALGGLSAVLVSAPVITKSWEAGAASVWLGILVTLLGAGLIILIAKRKSRHRIYFISLILAVVYIAAYFLFNPAIGLIEQIDSALLGYIGGWGMPIIFSWMIGGIIAGYFAWLIGNITIGLRSDYLAIATLGIAEILILIIRNEDWLARGVKNVIGLPRPVPYEKDLRSFEWFQSFANALNADTTTFSNIFVKASFSLLFLFVLIGLFILFELALKSPWGRMIRAIRDNEVAASAMGKNVVARKVEIFVLGSFVVGVAGAMLVTLEGQFTPSSYQPIRFTFLIWIMVILGGSGNNWGAVLGGFLIWFVWVESEPIGLWLIDILTIWLREDSSVKIHLMSNAPHMRLLTMGLIMIFTLRFFPKGLIPEAQINTQDSSTTRSTA
ncbi:MAG: branched-chain amino acid ABC transporter permease [Rhodobacteraceae bacterium]|nr:branched-chain amino acid ABC transporter permease [Paracoccaceae bacterium]